MPVEQPLSVLLVEDNPGDIRLFKEYLKSSEPGSIQLEQDTTVASCLQHLNRSKVDVILLDLSLPDSMGLDTLKQVHHAQPDIPVIILTGNHDPTLAVESIKNGAEDYLIKGEVDSELLIRSVRYAMERHQLSQRLQEERQRYELVAMGSNDGLWDWDLKTNKIYYSTRWKMMLGYNEDEITASVDEWVKRIHPEDVPKMTKTLADHLAHRTANFMNEHRIKHKDGKYRWFLTRGIAVFNSENVAVRIAGSFTDISYHKQLEKSLAQQAYYDPLTKMPNRLLFTENLKRAFARFQRNPKYLFAVLFLDLDHFKYINDHYGHLAGDKLLAEFASRLKECLRPADFLARVGGDEFNILLEDLKNASEAVGVAERILEALLAPFPLDEKLINISTSIGIAFSNWACPSSEELVKAADHAMYKAKQTGKARYEIFHYQNDQHWL